MKTHFSLASLVTAVLLTGLQPAYALEDRVAEIDAMRKNCKIVMDVGVCRTFNEAKRAAPPANLKKLQGLGFGLGVVTKAEWYDFNSDEKMCERIKPACQATTANPKAWESADCRIARASFKQR